MDNLSMLLEGQGMTATEAKIYLALLGGGPANGYEVSRAAGVPRSKVYVTLDSLAAHGFVLRVREGRTTLYRALPADDLLSMLRRRNSRRLDDLTSELNGFPGEAMSEELWHLSDYDAVMSHGLRMVACAERQILVQAWSQELTGDMDDLLARREAEGLAVLLVLYDQSERYATTVKNVYRHGFEGDKLRELGGRWLNVVIDGRETLYATMNDQGVGQGHVTSHRAMVFFAAEYVIHDAYCLRLIKTFGKEAETAFGDDLEGVRNVFETSGHP